MLIVEFEEAPLYRHTVDFFVPPVVWTEIVGKKGEKRKVERTSYLVSKARHKTTTNRMRRKDINDPIYVSHYSPPKNEQECREIRKAFLSGLVRSSLSLESLPWPNDFGIVLIAYGKIEGQMWEGRPYIKRPDLDNILKQVKDALNPNAKTTPPFVGAWKDDAANTFVAMQKRYAQVGPEGQYPGVMCRILFFESPVEKPKKEAPRKARPKVRCEACGTEQMLAKNGLCSFCGIYMKNKERWME